MKRIAIESPFSGDGAGHRDGASMIRVANTTTAAVFREPLVSRGPPLSPYVMAMDPGLASGAVAVIRFAPRPEFVASAEWRPKATWDLPRRLAELRDWLQWFRLSDSSFLTDVEVFCYEEQRWAQAPNSGVRGRTNADALQPLMAQAVALGWACWAREIVAVQPMQVRAVTLGRASGFRCPVKLPAPQIAKLRRQHDKRLDAQNERAVRSMVAGIDDADSTMGKQLSVHEVDAIACALAARQKLAKAGRARCL